MGRVRERLSRILAHPVSFLMVINAACAAVGLAQFAVTLVILVPRDFAVIGVLMAIGGVVTGLLDVKLADLTTKLFFDIPKGEARRRGALLAASLVLHVSAGLVTAALTFGAASLLAGRFLATAPEAWWIAVLATRVASLYPMAALTTFLRLLGDYRTSGWLRLGTQVITTATTILALRASPDLTGYFIGTAAATVLSLGIALATVVLQVRGALAVTLLQMPTRATMRPFLSSGRFLSGGSLAGMSKLLSRSCDVLVVASLGNDTMTGLYRVARQGYDTLAGLTDAVHQFYTPTIVDCIARERWADFRKHRARLMLIGLAAATAGVLGSWVVLRPLAAAYYPHYGPALPAFEIFAGMLVVTLGIHGWLWPTLVASGRIGWFGILGIAGAVSQLGAMALLAWIGHLTVATAASAAWIMAAVGYGPLLIERVLRRSGLTS